MRLTIGRLRNLLKEVLLSENIDVSTQPERVDLTWDQVVQEFPEAARKAQEDHAENVRLMKQDGEWDDEEPGILPPDQMQWWIERVDQDMYPFLEGSLPAYPGYALFAHDKEAVASYHGGGSTLMWTGEEWEM